MRKSIHVVPIGPRGRRRRWGIEEAGVMLGSSPKKPFAVRIGRLLAVQGGTSLRVHKGDGRIQYETSHGNETKRPG